MKDAHVSISPVSKVYKVSKEMDNGEVCRARVSFRNCGLLSNSVMHSDMNMPVSG